MLSPKTVAVVGANESLGMSNNAVIPMLEAGNKVFLVNPNRDELYGQHVYPNLTAIGQPIDAVLSLVSAARSIDVVSEASAMACGGVAVAAAGFTEGGQEGVTLQGQLAATAGTMAIVGPNCSGFKNVGLGVNLFTGGRIDLAAGGVGIVSQSGFLVRSAMAAAAERALGVSIAVSCGNEAVCDLADYVTVLAAHETTNVICLVIETIRRPREFFEAVALARAARKPVIALKLGRTDRSRRIMQSHTGAIADSAWVYDVAFREHGVIIARDIDDLLDRAQLFEQIPVLRRTKVRSIGMITTSGGVAALAADIADDLDAPLSPLMEIETWVRERVPGDTVNPLDLTGFVMSKSELMEEVFDKYAANVDALVLAWWAGDGDENWSRTLLTPFANSATRANIPFVVSPVESTGLGPWVDDWRSRGLTFTRGITSTYRALESLGPLVMIDREAGPARHTTALPRPATMPSTVGPMVTFVDAMTLLANAGFTVAPFVMLEADDRPSEVQHLGDSLVVKLADVPHRTELGAVRLNVPVAAVAAVADELRAIARSNGVPETVVVQGSVSGFGEAFAGLQCDNQLGSVALFGLGGVLVEVTKNVGGRMLPLSKTTTESLANEVAGPEVFAQLRGQTPWPEDHVNAMLNALNAFWRANNSWLASVDLNPLIVTPTGLVAVDALIVAQTTEQF